MMKKLIIGLVTFFVLFAGTAFAAPFLVCDPPTGPEVDKYEIELDGVTIATDVEPEPDGSLKYDMVGTSNGNHTVRVRAGNEWGWSNFSIPLDFVAGVPGAPANLDLSIK